LAAELAAGGALPAHAAAPVAADAGGGQPDVADRDGPELVDALVFTVWELVRQDVVAVPPKVRQALQAWRQTLDARRQERAG
jgi:hypothetical protein